jgi:hypothetical protein
MNGVLRRAVTTEEFAMHRLAFALAVTMTIAGQPASTVRLGVVQRAATALGGTDRIRATKNITLVAYGQYAYQFGGGRVTGDPKAPEKYIAANELTRVYDLEHGRFQLLERRNMLFPFLGPFGHSWTLKSASFLTLDAPTAVAHRNRHHRSHGGGAGHAANEACPVNTAVRVMAGGPS